MAPNDGGKIYILLSSHQQLPKSVTPNLKFDQAQLRISPFLGNQT